MPRPLIRTLSGVLLLWMAAPALAAQRTVVYHIDDTGNATLLLRNLANHRAADPSIRLIVVALAGGVDFLIDGGADPHGNSCDALVDPLMLEGVEFRVCANTLKARGLDAGKLLPEVQLVPSGGAEIARLQLDEDAAYIRP